MFNYYFVAKILLLILFFVFCLPVLSDADNVDVSKEDIDDYTKQLNVVIAKPTNVTCKMTLRYGLSRSLEDALKNGPVINVKTSEIKWLIRDKKELYESVHALDNEVTGIIETFSPVSYLDFRGTYFTDGKYVLCYPYHLDEIPHGQVTKLDNYDTTRDARPISLSTYLDVFDFINAVNNTEMHNAIKTTLDIDSVNFTVKKSNNHELIIQPIFMKAGMEFTKYVYKTCYDIRDDIVPIKHECFYEGKFFTGHYVIGSMNRSGGKYFPKKLITIFRYHSGDKDDAESFQKMMDDERLVVSEFIVDSIDFDRVPEDDEFKVVVPPDVSLFANEDSTRSISLQEGKNVVGLHNLKHLSDRAELQYQPQERKSAMKNIEGEQFQLWRVICFLAGVLILGVVIYISIRKGKKINKGE
jgi:hypothetical protein